MSTSENARPSSAGRPNISSSRESVESFVFVFVFFLVLGVEAEGFVIPTGSMAPTLMGRHKEVTCPQCGFVYTVNADREINDESNPSHGLRIEAGTCVNCRFQAGIADEPNFQGDRIYVMKTPIRFPGMNSPTVRLRRWDVAVFKLPEKPEVRYIKRLVGMPNETLRIYQGDIWVSNLEGTDEFTRPARSLRHQDAMQIMVYDDNHRAQALAADPRWARWVSRTPDGWKEDAASPGRYHVAPTAAEWVELHYRHRVPDPEQWAALRENQQLPRPPRETLITDFYAYNTDLTSASGGDFHATSKAWSQPHWVGDLTIAASVQVESRAGKLRLELVKAGITERCEIDLSLGIASLFHGESRLGDPTPVAITPGRTHEIRFANVDDRLSLQVDGRAVFGDGVSYFDHVINPTIVPTEADLDPVRIAIQGTSATVSRLRLSRDIYYTLDPARADFRMNDLDGPYLDDPVALFDWLSDPRHFSDFAKVKPKDYPIRPGYYMMLGDNSPWSRDGRAWNRTDQRNPYDPSEGWDDSGRESWEVPESLLIGKAFSVYWPHMKPFWPAIRVQRDIRLPARPNLEEMRWIR